MVAIRVRTPAAVGLAATQPLTALTSANRRTIIHSPLDYAGHRIIAPATSGVAGPFDILRLDQLAPRVRTAIDDLHILARNSQLREEVFGSAKRQKPLETPMRSEPLGLRTRDNGYEDFPVEVGFDLFTLNTKETFINYRTSNESNRIDTDYGGYASTIEALNLKGRRVVSLDSVHTHPNDLFPTLMDRDFFVGELAEVRTQFGPQPFGQWRMSTTMELEPVVHQVRLADWLTK